MIKFISIFSFIVLSFATFQGYASEYPGYYDKEKDSYFLDYNYFIDTLNYKIFDKYLNDALIRGKIENYLKIIDYKFDNYGILLKIAEQIDSSLKKYSKNKRFNNFDHGWTLIDEVKFAIYQKEDKYKSKLIEYYYLESFNLKEQMIPLIKRNHEFDTPWLHNLISEDRRMLPMIRHNINNYYPIFLKSEIKNEEDINYSFFSYMKKIFSDNSRFEILGILENYEYNMNIENKHITITSSSQLDNKYTCKNLLDYDLNSAWVEGSIGDGQNEWIEIRVDKISHVGTIILFPGYGKNKDLFYANNRLKKVKVETSSFQTEVEFEDYFGGQIIHLAEKTDRIKISVLDVYKGSKYNDLCISEIMLMVN